MEDKLTSSSDMLFANVLNNILSDNGNLVKKLIFLLWIASETEQLKNDIHYYIMLTRDKNGSRNLGHAPFYL